jgi:AraC-like DNA-binding protein
MLDVIDTQYAEVVTLRTLSATVGRQPAYLGRLFRQEVGTSVRDYLTRVRLAHAASLVRDGVKIEAVAPSVGYKSRKNFYQQFKKHYGTTPVPYRTHSVLAATRERDESVADGRIQPTASAAGMRGSAPVPRAPQQASDPVIGNLGSIIRASSRAWRRAVSGQETIAQHFARLPMGTLVTNEAGRYIGANNAALSITGYSPRELYALSPREFFESAPQVDTCCVWQFLLTLTQSAERALNATIRTRGGDLVGIHLVTLRNLLWGRPEMSTMIECIRAGAV